MKKTIALSALVLSILAGLVSGSLALYQKSVDLGSGSVVAKQFVMTAAKSDGFTADVKIAPTEITTATFTVSNFDDVKTTETDMDLNIVVTLAAADDKAIIPYITARLLDSTDAVIGDAVSDINEGAGTITLSVNKAFLANSADTKTYKIELTWANNGQTNEEDTAYEGSEFGTKYSVTVTGTQSVA